MECRSRKALGHGRQDGAVSFGTLCILIVIAATVSLSLKLIPHYLDFRTMSSIVGELPAGEVDAMSKAQVYAALNKRFPLNSIYDVKAQDVITYERGTRGTVLRIDYEKREPLLMNIDVVISFEKQFEYR